MRINRILIQIEKSYYLSCPYWKNKHGINAVDNKGNTDWIFLGWSD
jgi:hypothetical protein